MRFKTSWQYAGTYAPDPGDRMLPAPDGKPCRRPLPGSDVMPTASSARLAREVGWKLRVVERLASEFDARGDAELVEDFG